MTVTSARLWANGSLSSPETGRPLYRNGPFLRDVSGGERWPVVEEIPYLRTGREELREKANARLDSGDEQGALMELLRDEDDWAPDPPPHRDAATAAIEAAEAGRPMREVMLTLGFGPVANYFSYRLSDPTYLAGLALIGAHWNAPRYSFELACGIGHYTRELSRRGVDAAAGDVVFAKLWLARRYLVPRARLVCFDASRRFPIESASADLVLCQDAFYFLPDKPHVATELNRISGPEGTIVVGHSHNAAVENFSSGQPIDANEHAALFTDAELYDDTALTKDAISGRTPVAREAGELRRSSAVCMARAGSRAPMDAPDLLLPPSGTPLYPNPLYRREDGDSRSLILKWPSARYRDEYAPHSGYLPAEIELDEHLLRRAAEEGAGVSAAIDRLARLRVLVDSPEGL